MLSNITHSHWMTELAADAGGFHCFEFSYDVLLFSTTSATMGTACAKLS